jgi:RNA polymerase sigma-70 factor (ECF subfamily)
VARLARLAVPLIAFWSNLPGAEALRRRPGIDASVDEKLRRAQLAWPEARTDRDRFAAHWARQLAQAADPARAFDQLHVEDLYLAFGCAEGDPHAMGELRKRLSPAVTPVIRQVDPSDAFFDEVQQQLLERLLVSVDGRPPRIAGFAGRTSLENWLRAVALRIALNLRRTHRRVPEIAVGEALLEFAAPARDPHLDHLRARYGGEIATALRDAIASLSSQERNVLKLHFVDGLSLNQIAAVYQVNKSSVSRWLGRARGSVLDAACRDLETRLGVPQDEFRSMIRALKSQVDLSLTTALKSRT